MDSLVYFWERLIVIPDNQFHKVEGVKMKKILALALGLLLCVPVFDVFAAKKTKPLVIGLSMSEDTQFLVNVRKAAEKKAKELGVRLISLSAQSQVEKQVNDVESLIARKVNAIILNPLDKEALGNAVDKVKAKKIPLVEVNTFTKNKKYDVYVGSDEENAGKIQGEFVKRTMGEKGNVVILYGVMGHSGQIGRFAGFKKSLLDTCPRWKVLADITGHWNRDEGLRIMEDWLQKFGNKIDLVAAQNDEMALGALTAVEAAGKLKKIKIIGIDAEPDGLKAVQEGKMALTVFQDSYGQGQKSVEVAVGLLKGKKYGHQVMIPFQEVTKDNVKEFISKVKEWK
jgi:ABC-type sugar transport system substrate-binding protein